MKKYNIDYSTKTADEWFSLKKWTAFLMRLPVGRIVSKDCATVREALVIRATASGLSSAPAERCPNRFSVKTDPDNERRIFVSTEKKQ